MNPACTRPSLPPRQEGNIALCFILLDTHLSVETTHLYDAEGSKEKKRSLHFFLSRILASPQLKKSIV
jgi:hypothetical protein